MADAPVELEELMALRSVYETTVHVCNVGTTRYDGRKGNGEGGCVKVTLLTLIVTGVRLHHTISITLCTEKRTY